MKRSIMEAMEYMDQKYIDEAVEYQKKTVGFKPFLKWGAVAACLVLVVSLVMGYLSGLPAAPQNHQIVLPPARYGQTSAKTSLARAYTLEEGVAEADAVAWIRVGNWLGEELDHPMGKTYFEAEVVECYKGELPASFVLKQYGSSKCTYKAFPLLTNGNELLLFLNYSDTDTSFGGCYYILGGYGTVMDVVQDDNGKAHISVRIPFLGEELEKTKKNYSTDITLREGLAAKAANDEIQSRFISRSNYIFAIEEIEDILKG